MQEFLDENAHYSLKGFFVSFCFVLVRDFLVFYLQ